MTLAGNIRKIMAWCPNARMTIARKSVQIDDTMTNAPGDRGDLTHAAKGWWNKQHNRILVNSICSTLLSVEWFILYGIQNISLFLAGFFIGLLYGVLTWASGMHSLDKIASCGVPTKFSKRRTLVILIAMIFAALIFVYSASLHGIGKTLAFVSGLSLPAWLAYLQVVYWEKKNKKILVVNGFKRPVIEAIASGV